MLIARTQARASRACPAMPTAGFRLFAGFYVERHGESLSQYYRMYSYGHQELPELIAAHLPARAGASGIFGHSMGGMCAGVRRCAIPTGTILFSAFAPIAARCTAPGDARRLPTISGRMPKVGANTTPASWSRAGPSQGPSSSIRARAINAREQLLPDKFAAAGRPIRPALNLRLRPATITAITSSRPSWVIICATTPAAEKALAVALRRPCAARCSKVRGSLREGARRGAQKVARNPQSDAAIGTD